MKDVSKNKMIPSLFSICILLYKNLIIQKKQKKYLPYLPIYRGLNALKINKGEKNKANNMHPFKNSCEIYTVYQPVTNTPFKNNSQNVAQ